MPDREENITESTSASIRLTRDQAENLNRLGRDLASRRTWWGQPQEDDDAPRTGQVIRCRPVAGDLWEVRVSDAVGAISVGDLQIIVEPKIPPAHFVYLLEESGHIPRLDDTPILLAQSRSLWDLVARWYVTALEELLRADLIRDYRPANEALAVVRGRVDARRTVRAFLSGSATVICEYEEFDRDNALNRVLLAAAQAVSGSPLLPADIRRRALRAIKRIDGVGPLEPGDLLAVLERRTSHYREPIALAAHVLIGQGRHLEHGATPARSFLFRTPELIEDGVRTVLATGLASNWNVVKRGLQLGPSALTMTPDLVFNEGAATGDVKYKLSRGVWDRGDFNQAVAFAAAFRARQACVIAFAQPGVVGPPTTPVGDFRVTHLAWPADPGLGGEAAAAQLIADVGRWLEGSLASAAIAGTDRDG